jgi:hypothetical protein
MSIADKITRLTAARDDIREAITNKGIDAENAGFEGFADLIDAIPLGYKAQYVSDRFVGTKSTLGPYIIDFEPKSFMIKCNDNQQLIYDNMVLSDKKNTLALFSGFNSEVNFADDYTSPMPQMAWILKNSSSTGLSYMFRNIGNLMQKTYIPETGKWSVTFSFSDSPTYAQRFTLVSNSFNIMFIGG